MLVLNMCYMSVFMRRHTIKCLSATDRIRSVLVIGRLRFCIRICTLYSESGKKTWLRIWFCYYSNVSAPFSPLATGPPSFRWRKRARAHAAAARAPPSRRGYTSSIVAMSRSPVGCRNTSAPNLRRSTRCRPPQEKIAIPPPLPPPPGGLCPTVTLTTASRLSKRG